jgi:hypothetical protein
MITKSPGDPSEDILIMLSENIQGCPFFKYRSPAGLNLAANLLIVKWFDSMIFLN